MTAVAVLFARADSNYKAHALADVYDEARDARTWAGGAPVVAHPPCRAWGRLRAFAKPAEHEKALALLAVAHVRRYGGVLEHPEASSLWKAAGLPRPGEGKDEHGGWTLCIDQFWWGHRARKRTWLYIVGCEGHELPDIPLRLGDAPCVVGLYSGRDRSRSRRSISKAEREHTPPALAAWLLDLAQRCGEGRA